MKRSLFACSLLFTLLLCKTGFAIASDTTKKQISLPLINLRLTSGFGYRIHPITKQHDLHKGIDLSARCDPVLSILKGRITDTGYNPVLGNYVRIGHGEFQSIYGHLSQILVGRDEPVEAGQPIAVTGATGRVTGEHLHFSIKFKDRYINPLHFLSSLLLPEQ
ncbi:M23 family metallopeptidase [Pedobacter sp. ASV28]|uniref:M23 family metallopeptidase n=1 Tax=Pedobacter sp. ASV28 TaxID=2795123 RepID=UPI0018EC124B|nr:M23 family metallopeptidase [Pedobacter sp. ASV28]